MYHRRDAGYDNLFLKANAKPIMMGRWVVAVPAAKPAGPRDPDDDDDGRSQSRRRRRRGPQMGGVVHNGSEIMLDQDWIYLTVGDDGKAIVQQTTQGARRGRRAVFKVHLLLTEAQKSGAKMDKQQRLMTK